MRKAWLVYHHQLSSEEYFKQLQLYVEAGKELELEISLVEGRRLMPFVGPCDMGLDPVFLDSLPSPDFVLFLDKDLVLGAQLEKMGYKLFNSVESAGLCDNKISTAQALAGLPQPQTIFPPLLFRGEIDLEYLEYLEKVGSVLGFPLVVKEACGSWGQQVYLAKDMDGLITISRKIGNISHLYQEFMAESAGQDLRIYVIDGKIVGAMARENLTDFRANLSSGGHIFPYSPTKEVEKLALTAHERVGAFYSGVDILLDGQGRPVVCEVNGSAHIKHYFDYFQENLALPLLEGILSTLDN